MIIITFKEEEMFFKNVQNMIMCYRECGGDSQPSQDSAPVHLT